MIRSMMALEEHLEHGTHRSPTTVRNVRCPDSPLCHAELCRIRRGVHDFEVVVVRANVSGRTYPKRRLDAAGPTYCRGVADYAALSGGVIGSLGLEAGPADRPPGCIVSCVQPSQSTSRMSTRRWSSRIR